MGFHRSWLACLILVLFISSCSAEPTASTPLLGSETVPGIVSTATTTTSATTTTKLSPSTPSDSSDQDAQLPPDQNGGTPSELSTDPAVTYRADTCFEPPNPGELAEKLDCDEPHTVEVYAVGELPGGRDAAFLGLDSATELCNRDFMEITGFGIGLATVFRRSVLRPSEETWATGERVVTCFVVFPRLTTERLFEINPARAFGKVSLYGMEAGDCYSDFEDSETTFTVVPCTTLHNAEVFVDLELDDGAFPGEPTIEEIADEACFGQRFTDFVGVDYGDSVLVSLRSRPNQQTWDEGDRTINCVLTDGDSHTESFEGSER